jgi:hypothetical protein
VTNRCQALKILSNLAEVFGVSPDEIYPKLFATLKKGYENEFMK